MHVLSGISNNMSRVALRFLAVKKTTVVVCPRAQLPAEVRLRVGAARIDSCSRWPQLKGCRQTCASQLRYSADDVSKFVMKNEGQPCAVCGNVLTREDWYSSRLVVMTADTARCTRPICFTCANS